MNNSGSEQSYNSLDFHLKSGSGSITNETIAPPDAFQPGPLMGNGTLVPGGSVEGDIVFQVISDDHYEVEVLDRVNKIEADQPHHRRITI